ncbi:hypothetical protein [Fischerella sp. PCC 9605]|uniref:hypothetical protein n=1 Tax=Fischerella sp. PCC 9605 TaxID=1173024 RepID=UPI0004B76E0A|nr:hypothetical protein [Fischerella sp. PCC 9605]
MSIPPREIWERLTPALQEVITDELQTVFQEVIYEYLRASNTPTPEPQSDNLHSSVYPHIN